MNSRELLRSAAVTELRCSSRKLGWSALALAALAVVIGNNAGDALDKLASAIFGVWAFYCFARYCGDSRDLERVRQRVESFSPSLPLRQATPADEALIRSYGMVLGCLQKQDVVSVARLPASKKRLKFALVVAASQVADPDAFAILREGYMNLSYFQPLPADGSGLAFVAAAEELLELEQEWATLPLSPP